MDAIYEIDLQDCPYCRGTGTVEDEQGWCVYVTCLDCGAQTAHASYETPEEAAAQQVAHLWNSARSSTPAWATEPAGYVRKGRKALLSVLFAAQPPFERAKLSLHCALNHNGLY